MSELPKSRPNAGVAEWIRATDESLLYVSTLSLGELRNGIGKLSDGKRKQTIQHWFESDVIARFRNRIVPADLDGCLRWRLLSAASERTGRPRPVLDASLASTAVVHNLVLVTRNERDFDHLSLHIINPWT